MPKTRRPLSSFVRRAIPPCAARLAGVREDRFLMELLSAPQRAAGLFARRPALFAFLFQAAAYIYRRGSLLKALAGTAEKTIAYGPGRILILIAALTQTLTTDPADARILILPGGDAPPLLREAVELLKKAGHKIDAFLEGGPGWPGLRRAFSPHPDGGAASFIQTCGLRYAAIVAAAGALTPEVAAAALHTSLHIVCLGEEAGEFAAVAEAAAKIHYVVRDRKKFSAPKARVTEFPAWPGGEINGAAFKFLLECGLAPVTGPRPSAEWEFPAPAKGAPLVSFALRLAGDEKLARATAWCALSMAADWPCELFFVGGAAPSWARELPVPWRQADELQEVCQAAAGEFIFGVKSGVAPAAGLAAMAELMRGAPEIGLCGLRILRPDGSLAEAGARFREGRPAALGAGARRGDLFYRVDRSAPLVSAEAFLLRKNEKPAFVVQGGHIGLPPGDGRLTVVCGEAEAYRLAGAGEEGERFGQPGEKEAAAAQDRYLPPAAKNRKNRPLNILYYSPYPSHPATHGNRSTIQHFGRILRQKGCRAHFALLGLERYDAASLQAMREAWDSFTILPYPFQDDSGQGVDIAYDAWYEAGLGEHIAWLCALHDIDLLFCSYVFQSKMLDFAPRRVMKVIDAHDKMGGRYAAQKARGLKTEFFSCSPEDEGRYLRRADIAVARREEEARYFNEVSGRGTALVIPHVEPPRFLERRFAGLNGVGLVASANKINLDLATEFLAALAARTHNAPPFSVRIAGQVASMLDDLPAPKRRLFAQPWVRLLGFVEDIGDFYASVDCVVSPVTFGTGINVKTVQAMGHGLPLVTTACGGKGIETGHPAHLCEGLEGVAEYALRLHAQPGLLEELAALSRERYTAFYAAALAGFDSLLNAAAEFNRDGKDWA